MEDACDWKVLDDIYTELLQEMRQTQPNRALSLRKAVKKLNCPLRTKFPRGVPPHFWVPNRLAGALLALCSASDLLFPLLSDCVVSNQQKMHIWRLLALSKVFKCSASGEQDTGPRTSPAQELRPRQPQA